MFEHVIFPASRWQVTQWSVHSAHPRGCAWTAGSFGGCTGNAAGASGTTPADGNVCWAEQFPHGGASAGRAATIKASAMMVLAMIASDDVRGLQSRGMIHPKPQVRCDQLGFQSGNQIVVQIAHMQVSSHWDLGEIFDLNHLKWEIGSRGALFEVGGVLALQSTLPRQHIGGGLGAWGVAAVYAGKAAVPGGYR